MSRCVFDASAALAVARGERGAEIIRPRLPGGVISAVNASECLGKLIDWGAEPEAAWIEFSVLQLEVASFDPALARATAALRPATRRFGLSLGDRACLALARARRLPVLTADRAWARLKLGVEVIVIR